MLQFDHEALTNENVVQFSAVVVDHVNVDALRARKVLVPAGSRARDLVARHVALAKPDAAEGLVQPRVPHERAVLQHEHLVRLLDVALGVADGHAQSAQSLPLRSESVEFQRAPGVEAHLQFLDLDHLLLIVHQLAQHRALVAVDRGRQLLRNRVHQLLDPAA